MPSFSKFIGAAALLACSFALTGCIAHHHTTVYEDEDPDVIKVSSPNKTTKVVKQRQFYYYASCQVYRDCESNRWHWRDGNVWRVGTSLPKTIVIEREVPYVVMIEANEPKHHHDVVVKKYPNKRADKSLPPQAQGKAKGHDKQNARGETTVIVERQPEVQVIEVVAPEPETVVVVEPQSNSNGKSEDRGQGNSNGNGQGQGNSDDKGPGKSEDKGQGKGKDKDKDKSDKKDKKDDKGKGKKD